MRWFYQNRFNAGLPWTMKKPFWLTAFTAILGVVYLVWVIISGFVKNKIINPILNKISYFPYKGEVVFILGTMVFTLGFALLDAWLLGLCLSQCACYWHV
jgi:O-antigen/teichoic acid export membrane protein